jgi:hypothetical protein
MSTLCYKTFTVSDFDVLVAQPFDLKSPFRSTVPLLAYWSNPTGRLSDLTETIGFSVSQDATLTFEYTVLPTKGQGKASHTDLMIRAPSLAVAVEAKYTEPDYDLVSSWLSDHPSSNRKLVLGSWLDMINSAIGCNLSIQQVNGITYQLIHRTASVCSIHATERAIIYHCFDLGDGHRYESQLRELACLIAAPEMLWFFLFATMISKSQPYLQMQKDWKANLSRDFSVPVRKLLTDRNMATFGQPVVTSFQ